VAGYHGPPRILPRRTPRVLAGTLPLDKATDATKRIFKIRRFIPDMNTMTNRDWARCLHKPPLDSQTQCEVMVFRVKPILGKATRCKKDVTIDDHHSSTGDKWVSRSTQKSGKGETFGRLFLRCG